MNRLSQKMKKRKNNIALLLITLWILSSLISGCYLKLSNRENFINRQKGLLFATNTGGFIFFPLKHQRENFYSKGFAITNQYNKHLKQYLETLYKNQLPLYLIPRDKFIIDSSETIVPKLFSVDTIKIFNVEIEFKEYSKKESVLPYESIGKENVSINFDNAIKSFSYNWMKSIYVYSVWPVDK